MATSVSASRWRTAWKAAMGWPNWIRSRAWPRASSSMAREAPTSSWAGGQLGQGHGPWPVAGVPPARCRGGDAVTGHLDEARARVDALDRPEGQVGGGHLDDRGPSPESATTQAVVVSARLRRAMPRDQQLVPDHPCPGGPVRPRAGRTTPVRRADAQPEGGAEHGVEGRGHGVGRPTCSNRVATAVRGSSARASCQPSSSRARSRAAPLADSQAPAEAALEQRPARRRPSPVGSRGRAAGGR